MPWAEVKPIIDLGMRSLCVKRYPNHPHGCPNYNKKLGCPPQAPKFTDVLDTSQIIYAIYNVFPFGKHVAKMRSKHPDWSERQLACCLYWQGTARKQLRSEIKLFKEAFPSLYVVGTPEAQGVNLTATMATAGIELEWPPKTITYQIVLAGVKWQKKPKKKKR